MKKEPPSALFKVGITGLIGSGKTTVAQEFERGGIIVLSADDLAKNILQSEEVSHAIAALFGDGILRSNGTVDTRALASVVFNDQEKLSQLESVVHPRVFDLLEKEFDELAAKGETIAAVEAALIFETGFDNYLDFIIVVDAPRESRLKRAARELHVPEEEIEKRELRQMPAPKKIAKADLVIYNVGSKTELRQQARFAVRLVKRIAGQFRMERDDTKRN